MSNRSWYSTIQLTGLPLTSVDASTSTTRRKRQATQCEIMTTANMNLTADVTL